MKKITDIDKYYSMTVSDLADTSLLCPECGRQHHIPLNQVKAGTDLISMLPKIIRSVHGESPLYIGVVYDRHIEDKLDDLFFKIFNKLSYAYTRLALGEKGLLLEASTELGDLTAQELPGHVDFLIGVGSGVICDLTKWIATKSKLPYLIMGTAASMNAYTSITGTMTENNVKSTRWLTPAKAVLMDSALVASAPHEMTCAGVGDLLARQVANADWMLSHLIRGTYFCPVPFKMMTAFQEQLLPVVDKLPENNFDAMEKLSDAILVSGYSMTILDGETSPSSGSEHVISHFFDFQHELFAKPKNLHGEQVGIGTIIMSTAYDLLQSIDPSKLDIDRIVHNRLSKEEVNQDNHRIFGEYHNVFDQVVEQKRVPDDQFRNYLGKIIESWDDIIEQLQPYLMPGIKIRQVMESTHGHTKLHAVKRTTEDAIQALLYGSHYRSRYTILDLFWELGLFPEIAHVILEESGVLTDS